MRAAFAVAVLVSSGFARAQRPSEQDVTALVERARQKALAYTQSLPDFLATEIIHRYQGSVKEGLGGNPVDTLTVQLRYLQHKEDHRLMLVDGKPTRRTFDTIEGSVASGEFGATLAAIFDPATQTAFRWQSGKNLRGRRLAVVAYEVAGSHSHYRLGTAADGKTVVADAGYHGVLEIDPDTGEVLHLEYIADHIPDSVHLTYAGTKVDYALAGIAGQRYLLPARSEMEMRAPTSWTRNVIEFREYRKFAADSSIDFGPPK
ncbi:MAG TPA: hypothetical protein VMB03_07565 [Bryobacteraceae bacterium]|nr:hypothetical protein [Bryobacteraceae bacterium]